MRLLAAGGGIPFHQVPSIPGSAQQMNMDHLKHSQPSLAESTSKWLFGFFGALAAFLLLPRTVKFLIRRFIWGVLAEVVAVVVAGLLTEKAAERIGRLDQ